MRLAVVLDLNVLASAVVTLHGPPGRIVDGVLDGMYDFAISTPMLHKLDEVLQRPYFRRRIGEEERASVIFRIGRAARLTEPDHTVAGIADDEEDDIVLGTAVAAGADYLVTGDRGLLAIGHYGSVRIVTARQFLDLFEAG